MISQHLAILPILIPLFTALLQLLPWGDRPQPIRRALGLAATLLNIVVVLSLLQQVSTKSIIVYALGDWQAPFGIVLMVDQLNALMVTITALLAFPVLLYGCYAEDNLGSHFQALFQFQLMGIFGAFLTGDLFNLFVFFEVLLISSYALLMHGGGKWRIRACLHYVLLNLTGSALFLISLGVIYGATGTLNMADLSQQMSTLQGDRAALAYAGGMLLLVVFGLKSAILPLHFWLPQAYSTTSGVAAALFAIMTKVGIYAIIRVFTLIYGAEAGSLSGIGHDWIWPLGMLTLAAGALGVLAARDLRLLIAYLVVISVGTMLASFSFATVETTSATLFYMVHSTFITGALFLLADIVAFERGKTASRIVSGRRLAHHGLLSVAFLLAAITIIGIPPLSGFVAKLFILAAPQMDTQGFWLWAFILPTTLTILVTVSRAGSKMFWHTLAGKPGDQRTPRGKLVAMFMLLAVSIAMTLFAQPIKDYTDATAKQLSDIAHYRQAVLRPELGGNHVD
ncbi:monovalent cation/H+ antiporter subunit D [Idiomarina tyrosinivorans]|uniref:Monovalent cation/H+ antiporter subunit D n=1 Tax=Idiomarina tyrosinivorans TaxID=1445662 RepID=A0A432ZF37_9GAMM|nr:monovalent cation/H+ antiporter subunit D [Idiomarina tyrosinivorans]RUO76568.1 monovalent cation/H+ antiporter subunit D [Idiomarina tyrosinivorans]